MTISKDLKGGLSSKFIAGELSFFGMMMLALYFTPEVTESSALELAQVTVLSVGLAICAYVYICRTSPDLARPFFLLLALLLFFCIIRELSYGRVFYYDESYRLTPEMKLYYKSLPLVKGLRAIAYGTLVLIPLYCLYQRLDLSLVPLLRQAKIYWIDVASLSISLVLAIYAERWLESPRLEEGAELFFYLVLVNICWKYAQNKQCAWAASRLDKAEKL